MLCTELSVSSSDWRYLPLSQVHESRNARMQEACEGLSLRESRKPGTLGQVEPQSTLPHLHLPHPNPQSTPIHEINIELYPPGFEFGRDKVRFDRGWSWFLTLWNVSKVKTTST